MNIPDNPLAGLRREHPRLIATADDFAAIDRADPRIDAIRGRCEALLEAPVSAYEIPDGKRLLMTSRRVVDRVYDLAFMFRMDGDARWRDRLFAELEAVANFPDWNPSHFLDTAEMAHACAIGYDWLYDDWTEDQRRTIRDAIVRHAFAPGLDAYRRPPGSGRRWHVWDNNWNVVCNGGLGVAALAIADEHPDAAAEIIRGGLAGLPQCLQHFAPDGGWPEGPSYWGYTLKYLTAHLASLETALGHDFGLSQTPGLDGTGLFPIHLAGPTGRSFNFSDAAEQAKPGRSRSLLWLARKFQQPVLARRGLQLEPPSSAHPLDLIWSVDADHAPLPPRDAHYRGVEAVCFRSAWDDPDAAWLAAQCGRNVVGHNQADLGSFVYEHHGVRWFVDLGNDNYNLPGYFSGALDDEGQRYTYYANRAEAHNVIVLNPSDHPGQTVDAGGRVTGFNPDDQHPTADLDLTDAYPDVARFTRRFEMPSRRELVIHDHVRADRPAELWWFLHTRAQVALADDQRSALLTQDGKQLRVRLESPEEARLEVLPSGPLPTSPDPPHQSHFDGKPVVGGPFSHTPESHFAPVRKLAVHLTEQTNTVIRVRCAPAE